MSPVDHASPLSSPAAAPSSVQPAVSDPARRGLLAGAGKVLAGAALFNLVDPLVRAGAWAAGSDAPEKTEVKIEIGRAHV